METTFIRLKSRTCTTTNSRSRILYCHIPLLILIASILTAVNPLVATPIEKQRAKAQVLLDRCFSLPDGWIVIEVGGASDRKMLGAERRFLMVRRDGQFIQMAVAEQWSVEQMRLIKSKLRYDCRESGFEIQIESPLIPADSSLLAIIQKTGLSLFDIEQLRRSIVSQINDRKQIEFTNEWQGFLLKNKKDDKTPLVRVRFTNDEKKAAKLFESKKLHFPSSKNTVHVQKPEDILIAFTNAVKDWSTPIVLPPATARKVFQKNGVKLPTLGRVVYASMYKDKINVNIKLEFDNEIYELLGVTQGGLKRNVIPAHFIRGTIKTDSWEFISVYDIGTKQRWLYCQSDQISWDCPVKSEADEKTVMRIIESIP